MLLTASYRSAERHAIRRVAIGGKSIPAGMQAISRGCRAATTPGRTGTKTAPRGECQHGDVGGLTSIVAPQRSCNRHPFADHPAAGYHPSGVDAVLTIAQRGCRPGVPGLEPRLSAGTPPARGTGNRRHRLRTRRVHPRWCGITQVMIIAIHVPDCPSRLRLIVLSQQDWWCDPPPRSRSPAVSSCHGRETETNPKAVVGVASRVASDRISIGRWRC